MDGPEDDESDIYGSDEEPLFHSVVSHIAVTRGYSFSRIGRERRLAIRVCNTAMGCVAKAAQPMAVVRCSATREHVPSSYE